MHIFFSRVILGLKRNFSPTRIQTRVPNAKSQPSWYMASLTRSAPKREKDPKKRVVVTGMGVVSAFGTDVDCFYNKLLDGQSGVSLIDRFDTSSLPVKFAGQIRSFTDEGRMDEKIISYLDPCWRYCLVAGTKALEHANLGPEVLKTVSSFFPHYQATLLKDSNILDLGTLFIFYVIFPESEKRISFPLLLQDVRRSLFVFFTSLRV